MATGSLAQTGAPVVARRSSGVWRDAFSRLRRNKLAMVGLVLVIALFIMGVVGPLIAPHKFYVQDVAAITENSYRPLHPFDPLSMRTGHILGTDDLGRDSLSRALDGAQISVSVALVVQFVVLLIGLPLGALAGWLGGRLDNLLMRFTDVMYAFPDLLLIILMSVTFRNTWFGQQFNGLLLVFVAIGLTSWVTVARLVRGQLLSLKEMEFVEAAKAIGVSDRKIVTKHLMPNAIGPIIVAITLGIPGAILAEATLAYLGVGVQPPRASWGSLISEGVKYIRSDPHLVLIPAVLIATALISFTFLGDGLRDALDPKLKGKQ
ncbi:MAG: ABC transporter permease [Nocardioidaceae bacterium]|nr:ABC transporter permease [Nocardioidaceae bacterium]